MEAIAMAENGRALGVPGGGVACEVDETAAIGVEIFHDTLEFVGLDGGSERAEEAV